jgi:hypothetical protein
MNEVRSRIPAQPRLGLDEHGKVARVKGDVERVAVHTLGDNRVDLNDTELAAAKVLVGVRESGLNLGAVRGRG